MTKRFSTLLLLLALSAGASLAQETTTTETTTGETAATSEEGESITVDGNEPGALGLSMGTPEGQEGEAPAGEPKIGEDYVAEVHGDWELRCVKTENGADPCQVYQLLKDEGGNSVAEFSMFNLPSGGQAAAGATIITPLETLLTQQIALSVDGGGAKRYPFTFCTRIGCVARVGFTANDVATFKRGNAAAIVIVPATAPDQKVTLTVSLTGFTKGYDAMVALNAANAANAQQ